MLYIKNQIGDTNIKILKLKAVIKASQGRETLNINVTINCHESSLEAYYNVLDFMDMDTDDE